MGVTRAAKTRMNRVLVAYKNVEVLFSVQGSPFDWPGLVAASCVRPRLSQLNSQLPLRGLCHATPRRAEHLLPGLHLALRSVWLSSRPAREARPS